MPRPYIQKQNAMDVIGHHHMHIQFHIGQVCRDGCPASISNLAIWIEHHLAILNFTKQMFSLMGANGHKIYTT